MSAEAADRVRTLIAAKSEIPVKKQFPAWRWNFFVLLK